MLYSFTSCGWFFSEISGLEAMQNLSYACRALQLGIPPEKQNAVMVKLMNDLESAPSNIVPHNGKTLFMQHILPYSKHQKILAFTATTMRVLGVHKSASFQLFEYTVTIPEFHADDIDGVRYNCFNVDLDNCGTGELFSYSVCVTHRSFLDVTGWVIEKRDNPGHRTPESWQNNPDAVRFTFEDLFPTSRQDLENYFLNKISNDTGIRFNLWMKKNQQELDLLSYLNTPLPDYCAAPLSFVINRYWISRIQSLKECGTDNKLFEELLSISKSALRYGVELDLSTSAVLLEKILIIELQRLTMKVDGDTCDRIRFLLNVVDRFAIPVSKNKLEDIFQPFLKTEVISIYRKYKQDLRETNGKEDAQTRYLLLKLISFAQRMNFNTDMFDMGHIGKT
jgi:hypothetical protein